MLTGIVEAHRIDPMRWWDSTTATYQVAQWLTYAAVGCGTAGLFSWSATRMLAIPMIVIATACTACGVFAWFRLAHLREIAGHR